MHETTYRLTVGLWLPSNCFSFFFNLFFILSRSRRLIKKKKRFSWSTIGFFLDIFKQLYNNQKSKEEKKKSASVAGSNRLKAAPSRWLYTLLWMSTVRKKKTQRENLVFVFCFWLRDGMRYIYITRLMYDECPSLMYISYPISIREYKTKKRERTMHIVYRLLTSSTHLPSFPTEGPAVGPKRFLITENSWSLFLFDSTFPPPHTHTPCRPFRFAFSYRVDMINNTISCSRILDKLSHELCT